MVQRVLRKFKIWALMLVLCAAAGSVCGAQTSSGFFRVEQREGVWWFITPGGKPFFSNGVNVVDVGEPRELYDPKLPSYAAFRYHATTDLWIEETVKRLKSWNFNTIGGWADESIERRGGMPYTKVLHLAGSKYVPWGDMFGAEVSSKIESEARQISALKDDKNLIGYFTDNELGWWDDTVFWHFLSQPSTNKTRGVLMKMLREHYGQSFARLRKDFDTGSARSFPALDRDSVLTLKPNSGGAEVIDKFLFLVAQRYYKLVHDAIRRHDPNHLILGDRYPSWYSQSVVRASIPYVDVVSTNYMADWTDGNISHFYLDSLYRIAKKPVIVTEYYMSATENRSGNKNSSATFPVVQTQKERAISFRRNLTSFAQLPYVVGAHWFQYTDEPTFGRSDGENYNMGLIDIHNIPYEELTETAASTHPDEIHAQAKMAAAKTVLEMPRAGERIDEGLRWWNKAAALVSAERGRTGTDLPFADMYASWDKDTLYLAVYAVDFVEGRLYARGAIPESEQMTWTIDLGQGSKPLTVRFGWKNEVKIDGPQVESKAWVSSTRSTVLLKIPASIAGKKDWQRGDVLALTAKLASHSRAETMGWKETVKFSDEQ